MISKFSFPSFWFYFFCFLNFIFLSLNFIFLSLNFFLPQLDPFFWCHFCPYFDLTLSLILTLFGPVLPLLYPTFASFSGYFRPFLASFWSFFGDFDPFLGLFCPIFGLNPRGVPDPLTWFLPFFGSFWPHFRSFVGILAALCLVSSHFCRQKSAVARKQPN